MTLAVDILVGFHFFLLPVVVYAFAGFFTYVYAGFRKYRGGNTKSDTVENSPYFYRRLHKVWSSPSFYLYIALWFIAAGCVGFATWYIYFTPSALATNLGLSAVGMGLGHAFFTMFSTIAIFYGENLMVGTVLYFLFTLAPAVVQTSLIWRLHVIGPVELWAAGITSSTFALIALLGQIYLIQLIWKNSRIACGTDGGYERTNNEDDSA